MRVGRPVEVPLRNQECILRFCWWSLGFPVSGASLGLGRKQDVVDRTLTHILR